jgi:uncharacterized protein (TIGR03790 family)
MNAKRLSVYVFLGACLGIVSPSFGLSNSNVLVLYNPASAESVQIATYYAQVHPGVQQLALNNVPTTEQVSWNVYLGTIRPQVVPALNSSIDCIVTTKGLPLRIYNPNEDPNKYKIWNTYSSLESELARVDSITTRTLMGNQKYWADPPSGNPLAQNPYYYYADRPFDYDTEGIRLTSRLDGFTVADVTGAINRAQRAVIGRPGYTFLVDDDPSAPGAPADRMETLVSNVLIPRSIPRIYDSTTAFIRDANGPVLGYVSHGVHGGAPGDYILNPTTGLRITPASGGIFHTYESYNAYTFDQNSIGQMPARQGLVAEWLHLGGAAGVGCVQEPGVSTYNITNEERMFQMLLDGYTWAEAAWRATYQLSSVNTIVGDPLMRLRPWVPGDSDLDGDVDLFDISAIKSAYGTRAGNPGYNLMADMNANGVVDFWDLSFVKSNYTGSLPHLSGMMAIPEPSCLSLLLLAGLGTVARRRLRP